MLKRKPLAGLAFLLFPLLTLSGCNVFSPKEPTPDVNAIFTAAAETVAADLTQTAAAAPTSTFTEAPSPTVPATNTPGTLQPLLPGIGTPLTIGGSTMTPKPGLTLLGFSTATKAAGPVADKCEWQRNDPADGAVIDPNRQFDLVYYVKNAGTTTWSKQYKLRYYVGDYFTDAREFNLLEEIAPGQIGRAIADATAPSTKGNYQATFVLTNAEGVNFCVLDYRFTVGSSAAATEGPTATSVNLAVICPDPNHHPGFDTECTDNKSWLCNLGPVYVNHINICP